MKQTIIFFMGIYDTLDLFTEKLREAMEEMGYHTFLYDAGRETESRELLLEMLRETEEKQRESLSGESACDLSPYFACITFNNMGYNLEVPLAVCGDGGMVMEEACFGEEKKENLWEHYGIPYINILMDHPFHYEKPLKNAPATSVVLCTDKNHVHYIRRYFFNISRVDFLPHAGVELGHWHKPLEERRIDVLYAGALPVYTVGRMIPDLAAIPEVDGEQMMQEVLKELVAHPCRTTEEVIEEYLRSQRNDWTPERLKQLIVTMRFLDSYATSFFREQAVRLLVESGITVTAYGVGWDQCEWSGTPYLHYGGKVLAPEILPLMNDSKIVLNTMTWFKAGAHDRIFNGMLAKAAVVTDDSAYLREEFTDGKELVMFSLTDMAALPERVFDLFGHRKMAQEMADCGYEAAQKHHTWRQRAEYIAKRFL